MDFGIRFDSLKGRLADLEKTAKSIKEDIEKTEAEYAECLAFTDKFLKCCSKHRIKVVAIGRKTDKIEESKHWYCTNGSVFAEGRTDVWPSIWSVCEEMNVDGGCGNTDQHQLNALGQAKLIEGVYEFKDGKWHKMDE